MGFCQGFCKWVFQPPRQLRDGGIYSHGCKQGCFQPWRPGAARPEPVSIAPKTRHPSREQLPRIPGACRQRRCGPGAITDLYGRSCHRIRQEGFLLAIIVTASGTGAFDYDHAPESVEIYCLKCRAKTASRDVEQVTMKNGRPALRAVCSVCGTGKYRIGSAG